MILKAFDWFMLKVISPIGLDWLRFYFTGRRYNLSMKDHFYAFQLLKDHNYIILNRRNLHLSTYLISLGSFLLSGRFSYYSHIFLNIEDEDAINYQDLMFLEAVSKGVKVSHFLETFNCDSVCFLKPRHATQEDWLLALQEAKRNVGKKYDTTFNMHDASKMSCAEFVFDAIKEIPDYMNKFPVTVSRITKEKQIHPEFFYNNSDFEIVWEIRR